MKKKGPLKEKLHTTITAEVMHQMNIQCAIERRRIGIITEELYREYLEKKRKPPRGRAPDIRSNSKRF